MASWDSCSFILHDYQLKAGHAQGLTVRPEPVERLAVKPFMVRQGSPDFIEGLTTNGFHTFLLRLFKIIYTNLFYFWPNGKLPPSHYASWLLSSCGSSPLFASRLTRLLLEWRILATKPTPKGGAMQYNLCILQPDIGRYVFQDYRYALCSSYPISTAKNINPKHVI